MKRGREGDSRCYLCVQHAAWEAFEYNIKTMEVKGDKAVQIFSVNLINFMKI